MDYVIKDEPLELDLELFEQDRRDKVLGQDIKSLVNNMQIILQESTHDLKMMEESFERMKKRHAENLKITVKVLHLLAAYSTPPESPCHVQTINIREENSDDERSQEASQEHFCKTSLNDEFELLSYSLSYEPLNITTTTTKGDRKSTGNDSQKSSENESHIIDDHLAEQTLSDIDAPKREIKRERPVKHCLFCPRKNKKIPNKRKASHKLRPADECFRPRRRITPSRKSKERLCSLDGCQNRRKRIQKKLKGSFQELSEKHIRITPEVNGESSHNITGSYEDPFISPSVSMPQEADPFYPKLPIKGRTTFNVEQRQKIEEVFQQYVDNDCLPSIPTIRQMMRENHYMVSLVKQNNYQPCQFKGCLVNILNKRKRYNSTSSKVRIIKSERQQETTQFETVPS